MYVIFYTLMRGEEEGSTGNQFPRVTFASNSILFLNFCKEIFEEHQSVLLLY